MKALQKELKYFERNKAEWLVHYKGQFALVKGEVLVGTYTDELCAFNAGVEKFGNVAFLIKAIVEEQEVVQIPALSVGILDARS